MIAAYINHGDRKVENARFIYCATDEVLLISVKRQAADGGASQVIGSAGLNQHKSPLSGSAPGAAILI
ncbi:MAG: hypothetical protein RIQ45_439 [Actinomycetota bacterium]